MIYYFLQFCRLVILLILLILKTAFSCLVIWELDSDDNAGYLSLFFFFFGHLSLKRADLSFFTW